MELQETIVRKPVGELSPFAHESVVLTVSMEQVDEIL
jgi:hypothetical protein